MRLESGSAVCFFFLVRRFNRFYASWGGLFGGLKWLDIYSVV